MFKFIKELWSKWFRRRRPFRLTRGGWIFILYTIGVGAGAINTGNNLLYLIFGIFLGIIIASGFLSDMSLWYVQASLSLPVTGRAKDANFLSLRLINHKKWFPSLSLVIELEGNIEGEPVVLKKFIPVLYPKESIDTHVILTPYRRGWYSITRVKLATRFPFGLLYKWWTQDQSKIFMSNNHGSVILPEKIQLRMENLNLRTSGYEQVTSIDRSGEGATVFGVREYNESDNPKRIHWKASAKRLSEIMPTNWLVRELEADEKIQSLLLFPSLSVLSVLRPAEIENFIRFSVSLIEEHQSVGQNPQILIPKDQDPPKEFMMPSDSEFGDPTATMMAYLSLLDAKNPNRSNVERLLRLAPVTLDQVAEHQKINILETFQSWMNEGKHAA